jgi:hypothetical protein
MAEELATTAGERRGAARQTPTPAPRPEASAVRLISLNTQMAGRFRPPRSVWWRRWAFWLLTVVAIVAFSLAVFGSRGSAYERALNALSLFPSGIPSRKSVNEHTSTAFKIAMYLAPIIALWVTGSVIVALYARRWGEVRARRRRGHAVVCGLGEKGLRSARAFRHKGYKVTCIELEGKADAANDMRGRGAIVLEGDATQVHLLETARVERAAVVVCACHEDSANAAIAAAVEQLVARKGAKPVSVYVHIANPDLSGILRTPTFGLDTVRLHFFNIYDLWARALVEEADLEELAARDEKRPHIVVVGSTGLARSLVIWLARRWYGLCPDAARKLRITLIAGDARVQCAALERRYPALARTTELAPIDHPVASSNPFDFGAIADAGFGGRTTIYLCLFDDTENLSFALQGVQRLPLDSRVVVPASAWTAELAPLLLRAPGIRAVGYSSDPDSLDILRDSTREMMAWEVHDHYRRSGNARPESDVPWEELPEDLRESNRRQVDHMDDHLGALWYRIEPLNDWDKEPVRFSAAELETLSELEHLRWCAEKRRLGYRYGDVTSDEAKTHRDLLPWSELSDEVKEKDRSAVRAWPEILERAGYSLQRSPERERLAELIHERHRQDRAAASEPIDSTPLLRAWGELSEEEREPSRAGADDIGVKLARIGCRLRVDWGSAPPFSFTEAELEELSELEHERWCRQRRASGWDYGPVRDDEARLHPDLVPWTELPEDRRRIDRDHVRAIPPLVAEIGLVVVRDLARDGGRRAELPVP